jgi:hypothetical protein
MSFPDSQNVAPVFIEDAPDYGLLITVEMAFETAITVARESGEQRAMKRMAPLVSHAYKRSALGAAEFSRQKANLIEQVGAPIVIPVWTDGLPLSSMPTIDSANMGGAAVLDTEKFKVGSWAYMVQAGKVSTFRKILSMAAGVITFTALDIYPVTGVTNFTAGATVYPCILGMHSQDSAALIANKVEESDQVIGIEEL